MGAGAPPPTFKATRAPARRAAMKAFYGDAPAAASMADGGRGEGGNDSLFEDGVPTLEQIGPLRKRLGLPTLPDGWLEDVASEIEEAVRRRTLELADSEMEMPHGEASRPHMSRYIAVEMLSTLMMAVLKEALADISEHIINEIAPKEEKERVLAELAARPEARRRIFEAAARKYMCGGRGLI